jgi:hypothetical protein
VNVFELSKCIKLNMVKKCAMILDFSKDKSQSFQHHQFNSPMANQIESHYKISRWPNQNKVVHLHHIPLNNKEWTKCWRCDGPSKKRIALIHFNSPFPTLSLTNHVPAIKCMGTCGSTFHLTFRTMARSITNCEC